MTYRQITSVERYMLSMLRRQGFTVPEIARIMGRHPSTIRREIKRNLCPSGAYRPSKADDRARWRRSRSRRNAQFDAVDWALVEHYLRQDWSPEQVSGALGLTGRLSISHETIYQHIWADKAEGGDLHQHLRCAQKQRRKRYRSYDSRGRLADKRNISERPRAVDDRTEFGHWEIDTVMGGEGHKDCIVTLVERVTGWTLIGKLPNRSTEALNQRVIKMIRAHPGVFLSITADNGTEFHQYKKIEQATGVIFYFANPHHSWERGTNENTNGLIRQYFPKRKSMLLVDQWNCNDVAKKLNSRPRKRHGFQTPEEVRARFL